MPITRRCTKCERIKPLEDFDKAPRGKYGHEARCKECKAAYYQARRVPRPRGKRRDPFTGDEIKTCTRCSEEKPLREFSLSSKATEKRNAVHRSVCKPCSSARAMQWYRDNPGRTIANKRRFNLEKIYGITLADYDALMRKQAGVCAVCRKAPAGRHSRDVRLVVDHCHKTGVTRGLLCNNCNRAIGLLGDDPILLRRAIAYLIQGQKAAG
jgi:hypothetical protein